MFSYKLRDANYSEIETNHHSLNGHVLLEEIIDTRDTTLGRKLQ